MALTKDQLLAYLESELRVDPAQVEDTTPLFSSGMVDSFAIVELMLFLEQTIGTKLNPEDVTLDNLDSVQLIMDFAATRTG